MLKILAAALAVAALFVFDAEAEKLISSDPRASSWKQEDALASDWVPLIGAGENVWIGRTPVTNLDYMAYVSDTETEPPAGWIEGSFPRGEAEYPVTNVSYYDIQKYCDWLNKNDPDGNTYRLPTEREWETAAGPTPVKAEINCGKSAMKSATPVDYFAMTKSPYGAIDFWGNVWEWTDTPKGGDAYMVKGGSWMSKNFECRTEYRKAAAYAREGHFDTGFRLVKIAPK